MTNKLEQTSWGEILALDTALNSEQKTKKLTGLAPLQSIMWIDEVDAVDFTKEYTATHFYQKDILAYYNQAMHIDGSKVFAKNEFKDWQHKHQYGKALSSPTKPKQKDKIVKIPVAIGGKCAGMALPESAFDDFVYVLANENQALVQTEMLVTPQLLEGFTTEQYTKRVLSSPDCTILYYAASTLTDSEALLLLFASYGKGKLK